MHLLLEGASAAEVGQHDTQLSHPSEWEVALLNIRENQTRRTEDFLYYRPLITVSFVLSHSLDLCCST